jgi:hypothetical protein
MSAGVVAVAACALIGLWIVPFPIGPGPGAPAGTGWWEQAGAVVSLYWLARWFLLLFFALVVLVGLARAAIRVGRLGPAVSRKLGSAGRRFGARRILRLLLGLSATGGAVTGCGRAALPAPVLSTPAGPVSPSAPAAPGKPVNPSGAPATGLNASAAPAGASRSETPPPPRPIEPAPAAETAPDKAPSRATATGAAAAPVVWTVRPGDNLWSIAAAATGAGGESATAAYWVRLIEANRSRLPYPDDPNLIFAGDRIVLPPLPGGVPARLP